MPLLIISTNLVEAIDIGTLFKWQIPILLLGISSFNFTWYIVPSSKYSLVNSFTTHATPKFIFANSKSKSYEPSSNSGDILTPLDSKNFSTYFLELELGSKNIKGYLHISLNSILSLDKCLNFSPHIKISPTSKQELDSIEGSSIGRLHIAISISTDFNN